MAMVAAETAGGAEGAAAGTGAASARGARAGRGARARRAERGMDRPDRATRPVRQDRSSGRPDRAGRQDRPDEARSLYGGGGSSTRVSLPGKTYHRIVLAEFAACVILVGASPILTPRTKKKGDQTVVDASVTLAGPMLRLTAVCIVFFVLALMASGERTGKIAAAFGGLIVLGTLLNATDMVTLMGKVFKGSSSSTGTLHDIKPTNPPDGTLTDTPPGVAT